MKTPTVPRPVRGWLLPRIPTFSTPTPSGDPSAAFLEGIQRRLLLTYAAVFASLLILSGVLLYFGMRQALLSPVDGYLTDSANQISQLWQQNPPPAGDRFICPVPSGAAQHVPYIGCFGDSGFGTLPTSVNPPPPAFSNPSIAQAALASGSGQAWDTVTGEHGLGDIRRYALVVREPTTHAALGVVLVGIPIEGQLLALHFLLLLLIILGLLTLAGAMLGGILLSRRALEPSRLALQRQQAFIGDAAHELRTPLTLLRASSELLLRDRNQFAPDDATMLEDIVSDVEHMNALISKMLLLARLDSGNMVVERDVVDLTALSASVVRRASALAAERQVRLTVEPAPPTLVIGDPAQLEEVLLNLIDNAIKYNRPGGSVSVRISRSDLRARVEVSDTGEGVAPEHLPRLGERFYRVDKARSREFGGAGLGLSIALRIAAAHGGALTLSSTPDKGTTATLTLPAAGEKALPAPASAE
ncbi:MAG: Phosphate regulon sensor protein PhoR (SphS) [Ktedonobacterales bacterium]|jgi:signal transduction histidine kinase|nr:MAG: Phosphate regulon sensor protein PhoR (SphS) [Ktedonobacterales bacterium]